MLPEWHEHASAPGVVFSGGPVATEAVIALARGGHDAPTGWVSVLGEIGTVDVGRDPAELWTSRSSALRIFVGYAGWGPGQLEAELDQEAWFVVTTNAEPIRSRRPGTPVARRAAPPAGPRSRCSRTHPADPEVN